MMSPLEDGRSDSSILTPDRHRGGCLCGAIQYEVRGTFEAFFLCHCGRCRKGTGSAHAANLFAANAQLRWTSGEGDVRIYQVPGCRHQRAFCPTCGSPLPNLQGDGATLVVPAGSLDGPAPIPPTAHIFLGDGAGWDRALAGVPTYEGPPEG